MFRRKHSNLVLILFGEITIAVIMLVILAVHLLFIDPGYARSTFDPCWIPPDMDVDGGATSFVRTWHDLNRNGVLDSSEPPLSGVRAWGSTGVYEITDENGAAIVSGFVPGCACDCWEDDYVTVVVPEGYCPTTPTSLDLTGDEMTYYFGFVRDETCQSGSNQQ